MDMVAGVKIFNVQLRYCYLAASLLATRLFSLNIEY
jgi:hypothetical protein